LLLVFVRDAVRAQTAAAAECTATAVQTMKPADLTPAWAPYAPESLKVRFRSARERGAWAEVADTVAMLFGLKPRAFYNAPPAKLDALPDSARELLVAEFDSLRAELMVGELDHAAQLKGNVNAKRFAPTVSVIVAPSTRLFVGRPPGPINVQGLPGPETRSVCWLALTLTDLATIYGSAARTAVVAAYHDRARRWDNYARHGYSMQPFELFVNGYMPHADGEPPVLNLVFGHLSAGEEMFNRKPLAWKNLERRNVLTIEPVGFIYYVSNFSRYIGASWIITYPDSGGIGHGPMLHIKNVGHVAYLWQPRDPAGTRRKAILLSLDLYRYIAGVPGKLENLKEQGLRKCLAGSPACGKL
jgi:hypothetical protein